MGNFCACIITTSPQIMPPKHVLPIHTKGITQPLHTVHTGHVSATFSVSIYCARRADVAPRGQHPPRCMLTPSGPPTSGSVSSTRRRPCRSLRRGLNQRPAPPLRTQWRYSRLTVENNKREITPYRPSCSHLRDFVRPCIGILPTYPNFQILPLTWWPDLRTILLYGAQQKGFAHLDQANGKRHRNSAPQKQSEHPDIKQDWHQ